MHHTLPFTPIPLPFVDSTAGGDTSAQLFRGDSIYAQQYKYWLWRTAFATERELMGVRAAGGGPAGAIPHHGRGPYAGRGAASALPEGAPRTR